MKYDVLIASGCSFTFGSELDNRKKAWPFCLAKLLEIDNVINRGLCSGSNDYILRTMIEEVSSSIAIGQKPLVILGFTTENRREAFCNHLNSYVFLKHVRGFARNIDTDVEGYEDLKKSKIISHLNDVSQEYLMNFESNIYYNLIRKIDQILLAHSFLKNLNIEYLFFNSIANLNIPKASNVFNVYDLSKYFKKSILKLVKNYVEHKNFLFKNVLNQNFISDITMEAYCLEYPKGPYNHPLDVGHQKWAEFLYEKICLQGNNIINQKGV